MSNLKHVLLVLGAVVIIAPALYTLTHLNDRVVYTLLVPGIVLGLLLIVMATVLRRKP